MWAVHAIEILIRLQNHDAHIRRASDNARPHALRPRDLLHRENNHFGWSCTGILMLGAPLAGGATTSTALELDSA